MAGKSKWQAGDSDSNSKQRRQRQFEFFGLIINAWCFGDFICIFLRSGKNKKNKKSKKNNTKNEEEEEGEQQQQQGWGHCVNIVCPNQNLCTILAQLQGESTMRNEDRDVEGDEDGDEARVQLVASLQVRSVHLNRSNKYT